MIENVRLAVDVGGTFTDLVLLTPDGTAIPKKVLSTPHDFSIAVKQAIAQAMGELDLSPQQVLEYVHGATVATNAIITRSGARLGLITNQGFRDILEVRRLRMHRLYDLTWEKPPPLVPRFLRLEVPGRLDHRGEEVAPLGEEAARQAIQRLLDEGVESVAVCYLHAYANGSHEVRTRDLIQEMAPKVYVSISSEVLPEIREYERTSTTVINAYVQPVVSRYFESMERDLRDMGVDVPIMVMQSNGGMMPSETARAFPMHIIESGPAAGVTGAYHLAKQLGVPDAISLDIGGTTAKAALIEDGQIARSPEYEVGGAVSIGHSLMKGSGYVLRVPSVDLAEVGAGGGSIAWADSAGALKVGPHSAGADPGPACYNQGGREATITDANVVLGLTNPQALAGGALIIHPDLAEQAVADRVSRPLGLDLVSAAWGIRSVANSSLIRALRAVSTERGRDPRRFAMFAFGGIGPVHALDLANELGISKVIVPPLPGLFSSLGLLFAEVEHHLIQTHYATIQGLDYGRLNGVTARLVEEAANTLSREGYAPSQRSLQLSADVRYAGQDYALTIPLRDASLDPKLAEALAEDFHQEHHRTYGYRSDAEPVQIIALRCLARGLSALPRVPRRLQVTPMQGWQPSPSRRCYFGLEWGWTQTDVLGRGDLAAGPLDGPIVVEEDNSLTVVLPGWRASLDDWANIVLDRIDV
jgi:N-methylhydantoinase A